MIGPRRQRRGDFGAGLSAIAFDDFRRAFHTDVGQPQPRGRTERGQRTHHKDACGVYRQRGHRQSARGPPAHRQRDEPAHRVKEQDIAPPQQEEVREPEQRQPPQPPPLERRAVSPGIVCAIDEQQHTRPEQQREQPAEFAVGHHEHRQPCPVVGGANRCSRRARTDVNDLGPREPDDVEQEDAKDRDPAHEIERDEAGGRLIGSFHNIPRRPGKGPTNRALPHDHRDWRACLGPGLRRGDGEGKLQALAARIHPTGIHPATPTLPQAACASARDANGPAWSLVSLPAGT